MPFTLVKGGADDPAANSYADRADFLALFQDQSEIDGADLTAIAPETIERYLIEATRFVDQLEWNGDPKYEDNVPRLALPRFSLVVGPGSPQYREGLVLADDEVPWVVIHAVCILADARRVSGKTLWHPVQHRRDVLKRKKSIVGSEKEWADPLAARGYPAAMTLLEGLHRGSFAASSGRLIAV